jgi:hypothetical protein
MRTYLRVAIVLVAGGIAGAAPKSKIEPPAAADISAFKDKMVVWSDGKKHYVAMVMTTNMDIPIFWSDDGKNFYAQRLHGGGSEGGDDDLKRLDRSFWDPRVNSGYQSSLDYKGDDKKLTVQCLERKTPLQQLSADDAKKLVDDGKFWKARWPRYAYALARDNTGRYYYVDNLREPDGAKNFHLYAGQKGAMKLQKMTNVVSDSQGDIFSTPGGQLRLVISKQDSTWIQNEKPKKLVWVPVEDNHQMIYSELGVYAGEPLGTPCDAL